MRGNSRGYGGKTHHPQELGVGWIGGVEPLKKGETTAIKGTIQGNVQPERKRGGTTGGRVTGVENPKKKKSLEDNFLEKKREKAPQLKKGGEKGEGKKRKTNLSKEQKEKSRLLEQKPSKNMIEGVKEIGVLERPSYEALRKKETLKM